MLGYRAFVMFILIKQSDKLILNVGDRRVL